MGNYTTYELSGDYCDLGIDKWDKLDLVDAPSGHLFIHGLFLFWGGPKEDVQESIINNMKLLGVDKTIEIRVYSEDYPEVTIYKVSVERGFVFDRLEKDDGDQIEQIRMFLSVLTPFGHTSRYIEIGGFEIELNIEDPDNYYISISYDEENVMTMKYDYFDYYNKRENIDYITRFCENVVEYKEGL